MTDKTTQSNGVKRVRYGTYTDADREELAIRVKATDFNGRSFDGFPFSARPSWLIKAVEDGALIPHTRGHTDYAEWDVVTEKGVRNASPDDWIIRRENGELAVVDSELAYVLINLRPEPQSDGEDLANGR